LFAEPLHVPLYGDLWIADGTKETLLHAWETVIETTGLQVQTHARVEGIRSDPEGWFELHTTLGEFRAWSVVLAMGRRGTPRRLGIEGEDLDKVFYDVVEMEAFGGARVVVVGGGDSAIESALGIAAQPNSEVILSYRKGEFSRAKERNVEKLVEAESEGRLSVWRESEVKAVRPDEIDIEYGGDIHTIANDWLVIRIGGVAPYDFLREIGIAIVHKDVPLVGGNAGA
jgi:thioredoxin reductase